MNTLDKQYIELCEKILAKGNTKSDRTGTGTISLFGEEIRHDLSEGFPMLTTKSVHFKSVVGELLFFLRGDTNIKYLQDHKIKIWDLFATPDGEIGELYGASWRNWGGSVEGGHGVDQIAVLIDGLKNDTDSRRHLVSAWNVDMLPEPHLKPYEQHTWDGIMVLAPCHYSFQCYVSNGKLSMIVNQRSADMFLGVPFNIASYALLTHMLAQVCDLQVGELIWRGGDCHIYSNHVIQMRTQVQRYDNGFSYKLPKLVLTSNISDIDGFGFDDIKVGGYKNAGKLSGKVAI